jgi:hypothetical protein
LSTGFDWAVAKKCGLQHSARWLFYFAVPHP